MVYDCLLKCVEYSLKYDLVNLYDKNHKYLNYKNKNEILSYIIDIKLNRVKSDKRFFIVRWKTSTMDK